MVLIPSRARRGRSGQAMVFLVMIVVVILFIVLWNFDVHKTLSVKFLSQNAGDSAALAAARWQAVSLNLVGDLNIMQAMALMDARDGRPDPEVTAAISDLQARLCYVGPMLGLLASQQAAKNNGLHNNDEYTAYLREHASVIRNDYPRFIREPYEGCLREYADMLESVCDNGVAAGPDNTVFYNDYLGDHMLLSRDFYDAVATADWCWFFFNARDLLANYQDFNDWPPLPRISNPAPMNCEFFSLHLRKETRTVGSREAVDEMNDIIEIEAPGDRGPGRTPGRNASVSYNTIDDMAATWYCYDGQWDAPFAMSDPGFPSAGTVKPQFNYVGADAAIRTETTPDIRTPGARRHNITWTAAAKPFGQVNDGEKPNAYGIVLPSFHDVRLIPVDASSAPWGGSFDLSLRRHVEEHLPGYVANGIAFLVPGCWYCRQLQTWEDPVFRMNGVVWLELNSGSCVVHGGGGRTDGGGARRGH